MQVDRCYSRKVATGSLDVRRLTGVRTRQISKQRKASGFQSGPAKSDTGLQKRVVDDTLEKLLKSSGASQGGPIVIG
jgi:hypothetical protein